MVVPTGDLGSAVDWLKDCTPELLIIRPYVSDMQGMTQRSIFKRSAIRCAF
jgi:hypothetical protein